MPNSSGLPSIESYPTPDLERAKALSPALTNSLNLLKASPNSIGDQLRLERHQAWAECALATLLARATPEQICLHWSEATDLVTQKAWEACGCNNWPLAFFALGKWGAKELNLSSDIDVIFVSKDNPTPEALKPVREFIRLLTETTSFGFCYRVDTDLKPGGRLSPLISSEKQFEDYYWSFGATWERLALVRLRKIAGDDSVSKNIASIAQRYSYRKFLDYSLLEDLRLLRSKIHQHSIENDPHARNVKLAPGGIRDIELFIHALQIIHGGRQVDLRTQSTSEAARLLGAAQRFNLTDLQFLIDTYWRFRQIENSIQAENDQQTHILHESKRPTDFAFFIENSKRVENIVEQVLGRAEKHLPIPADQEELHQWLSKLGFTSHAIESLWPELIKLAEGTSRTFQDDALRGRVLRLFIEAIQATAIDKDLALALLTDFFRSIKAKTSFFALLAHEERLITELSLLFGCSPYLGGVIANRPELLDSLLFRRTSTTSARLDTFLELLTERRLMSETIGANQYLQSRNLENLTQNLSATADEICVSLMRTLAEELQVPPLRILALGKWGGQELGFRSDLDFIFLSDQEASESAQKLARRFVSRLTEKHRGGSIYPIDLRLRPSGKAGPVLVARDSLIDYLKSKADPWERQSYLRARFIDESSGATDIHSACQFQKLTQNDLIKLADIRNQLVFEPTNEINLKYSPGGLIDIEFFAQICILHYQISTPATNTLGMLQAIEHHNSALTSSVRQLMATYLQFREIEQYLHLFEEHASSSFSEKSQGSQRVAVWLKTSVSDLSSRLQNLLSASHEILKLIDPRGLRK